MSTDDGSRGVSLREVLTVLFKRKWFILSVTLLTLTGVCVGTLMTPPEYQASAMLMLTRARADLTVTPFETSGGALSLRLNPSQDLVAESELLKRRSLLLHVVKTLGSETTLAGRLPEEEETSASDGLATGNANVGELHQLVSFARPALAGPVRLLGSLNGQEPLTKVDRAIQALGQRLRVAPVENANLIRLTLTAKDPGYAGKVLDLLVAEYLDQYVRIRTNPGAVQFFEGQVQTLARDLREAEDAKQALEQKYGVRRLEAQTDLYLKAAVDRELQLQTTRSEVDGLREKVRVLRDQLAALPDKVRASEEIRVNPVQDSMRAKLLELELERNKLLQKYTDHDRRVQDVEREIALLRQRLVGEPNWEFARESYGPNPARTPLHLDLINAETQLLGATVKASNLERDLREAETRLDQVGRAVYDRQRLERKIKMLEENYLIYAKKFEEARISAAMDKNRIVNISVVEPVSIAAKPRANGRGALDLALLGAAFGLVLGVGGAFGREYFNRTFSTEDSVRRQLNLPVLGSIPEERR
jgi:uncharacterized protein involved in exopolysaccharide biosynthesis